MAAVATATETPKQAVIGAIDELIDKLAEFSRRVDRDVELSVAPDGFFTVMVAEVELGEEVDGFEQAATFGSLEELWNYLSMGRL